MLYCTLSVSLPQINNMADKIFPKGIRGFMPNTNAPDFVLGTIILNIEELTDWVLNEGKKYQTQYKDQSQIKLQLKRGKDGKMNIEVDTFVPTPQGGKKPNTGNSNSSNGSDDLPF